MNESPMRVLEGPSPLKIQFYGSNCITHKGKLFFGPWFLSRIIPSCQIHMWFTRRHWSDSVHENLTSILLTGRLIVMKSKKEALGTISKTNWRINMFKTLYKDWNGLALFIFGILLRKSSRWYSSQLLFIKW